MKAFSKSSSKTIRGTGLILLLDGEVEQSARPRTYAGRATARDEHSRNGILTRGFRPYFRLPGLQGGQWRWKFVALYSGVTVPGSHGVPAFDCGFYS